MESLETDGRLQIAGPEDSESAVVAALTQLFTALRAGVPSSDVRCSGRSTQLGEGDRGLTNHGVDGLTTIKTILMGNIPSIVDSALRDRAGTDGERWRLRQTHPRPPD